MKLRFALTAIGFAGLILSGFYLEAQVRITGTVQDKYKGTPLPNTTILDLSRGYFYQSDSAGAFHVLSDPGDLLVFTHLGYQPDTLMVSQPPGKTLHVAIAMQAQAIALSEVVVRGITTYQRDSIQRREAYDMLSRIPTRSLVETSAAAHPTGGFGLVLHPFGEGFMPQRSLRRFKRTFFKHEMEAYISYRYTQTEVTKVTALTGDSLMLFMHTYRPSYHLLRQSNELELESWIHYSYQNWIRKPVGN